MHDSLNTLPVTGLSLTHTHTHTHTTLLQFCVRLFHITLQECDKSRASSLVLQYVSEYEVVLTSVVKVLSGYTRGISLVAEECCQVTQQGVEASVL
jgi:hypothetical protein